MELRYCLNQGILERISKILGDTSNGLTGSEISYFLQQCNIKDVTPEITKWKRLYSALASVQNFDKCSNKILRFIQIVLNPARFTDNQIFLRNSFEMAKKFTYKTQGTCSKSIEIELEGDIVKSVRFEGGCHGNTQGIGLLTRGMQAADVIARLEGIDCKGRGTSCPDQLAKALASGPRTITATTKPENGPVLQNPGKQRKNKSSYTVSRTAPGNGAADVCRSPGPIVVTGD